MKKSFLALAAACSITAGAPAGAQSTNTPLGAAIASDYDAKLEALFIDFHQNPELSYKETRTAAIIAREWRAAGWDVTEQVGGTGVVGVMTNGAGPTVLLRADMDGLPVKEDSGLGYASTARQVSIDGTEKPVMHACGHDVHITSIIGTARRLSDMKAQWQGTVVLIAQPAEERLGGARMMMEDGLYERFPKPDYALAFHVSSGAATGRLTLRESITYSSADTVDIIVHGVGAHGASPHRGKDPILMGAQIIMNLQTLVSRDIAPLKPGVVTVGAFNSGFKHNIISDRATMQLTVRADDEETRQKLLAGIRRVAENVGRMNGLPEDKLPKVLVSKESTPATYNDVALTRRIRTLFEQRFGEEVFDDRPRGGMGAEDFAYFVAPNTDVPGVYFGVGGTPQADFDREKAGGTPVPSHHSPFFKVKPRESVTLGTEAMTAATLDLLAPTGN
ncbi:hippurate hydrolase [Parasphingorhabdus marina DSM 22363]|uniref:Hippurate hydrolase n=1 Tax=Parasphingorhabdus marina DSM 22363 TaxID=1123272 RepID=A0A1N6HAY5_9SPHN|nr:amidohydrolase [Parasphingorhabdus marina]SIO16984.1 hippurate hydrolase [Parasphingorhabdus marina DSM 22363]